MYVHMKQRRPNSDDRNREEGLRREKCTSICTWVNQLLIALLVPCEIFALNRLFY